MLLELPILSNKLNTVTQIFYVSKTYLPAINVETRVPWCSVWHNQTVKQRLAAEINIFGYYELVEVRVIFFMNMQVFLFIFLVIHRLFVC